MSAVDSFMSMFGGRAGNDEPSPAEIHEMPVTGNPLDVFFNKFGGPQMESFFFYDNSVEIRFDSIEHIYYLVEELGNLTVLLNVSTVSHIVDRSEALIPWAAKMAIEKLLRIIPTHLLMTDENDPNPLIMVPTMTLAEFTRYALDAKSGHKDKLEDAGEVGHIAHDWIEKYIKSVLADDQAGVQGLFNTMTPDPRSNNCVIAGLDWMKAHNVRWIATEKKCYSKQHKCSGTMDGLALVDSCQDPTCCTKQFTDHLSLIDWKTSNFLYIEFLFQTAAYQGFHTEEFPDMKIVDRWILRLGKDDGEFDPWYLPGETFEEDYEGFLACLHLKRIVKAADERLKVQKQGVRAAKKAQRESQREIAKAKEKADKAAAKAQLKIDKEEEKKRVKAEAAKVREAAREEARKLKETNKLAKNTAKAKKATPSAEETVAPPSVPDKPEDTVVETPAPVEREPGEALAQLKEMAARVTPEAIVAAVKSVESASVVAIHPEDQPFTFNIPMEE